jgi:hypothetical protein
MERPAAYIAPCLAMLGDGASGSTTAPALIGIERLK